MIVDKGKLLKMGHVTLTKPLLKVVCHCSLGFDTVYLHAKFMRYDCGHQNLKWVT